MNTTTQQIEQSIPSTQIRHLLYLFELLNQVLEVKIESVYALPAFLHHGMARVKSRQATGQMTEMGEALVHHVKTLHRIITDLGGQCENIMPQMRIDQRDPVAALTFQEELAGQILEECRALIERDWQASARKCWLQEQLALLVQETAHHTSLIEHLFAHTEPRYRDLVLERFRVTALP